MTVTSYLRTEFQLIFFHTYRDLFWNETAISYERLYNYAVYYFAISFYLWSPSSFFDILSFRFFAPVKVRFTTVMFTALIPPHPVPILDCNITDTSCSFFLPYCILSLSVLYTAGAHVHWHTLSSLILNCCTYSLAIIVSKLTRFVLCVSSSCTFVLHSYYLSETSHSLFISQHFPFYSQLTSSSLFSIYGLHPPNCFNWKLIPESINPTYNSSDPG
jgi:hypothetical protein